MIKKSIILFIILFCLYSLLITRYNHNLETDQYEYQTNIIKVEKYIYGNSTPDSAVLGTSLSARMVQIGIDNLAMSGLSIYDGYQVLLQRKEKPKVLFIEINFFINNESPQLANTLNSKTGMLLKQVFPDIRDENQPIGLLKGYFLTNKKKSQNNSNESVNIQIFNNLLADKRSFYSHPDTGLINKSIVKLKMMVNNLEHQGIKVCFFEMPINHTLINLPYTDLIRNSVRKNFPGNKFIGIPSKPYQTTDGLHLGISEAIDYSQYFKNSIHEVKL